MEKQRKTSLVSTVFLGLLLALSLLAFRVIDLQAFQGQWFADISYQNRLFRTEIPAERGVFLDRYGDSLVVNQRAYHQISEPTALYPQTQPITRDQALELAITQPFSVNYSLQRQYLRPFSMAHVLGYVTGVTAEDLQQDNQYELTDSVGRAGLESYFNDLVKGRKGYREYEINALGKKLTESKFEPPVQGRNLQTSLDPYLSTVAWQAMGNKTGSVVILDPKTGQVLALVSTPAFDSNLFSPSTVATEQETKLNELRFALADEKRLFFNRSVNGTYPPGSIFKLVTALAGLESGSFDTNTQVDDQGILEVGEYRYANWYYTQYGRTEGLISLVRAIARSNDTYFYKAAELLGVDNLVKQAELMGFGSPTGIELNGERAGLVPNPSWKEKTLGEKWFLGNTFHLGIGQGDLLVTPLQQAQMLQVFANHGHLCKPSLLADPQAVSCSSIGASEANLLAVEQGMIEACSTGGTAYPFFPWNQQRSSQLDQNLPANKLVNSGVVACKTGTAEFGGEDERGYRHTHAWFGMTVGGLDQLLAPQLQVLGANTESKSVAIDTTAEPARDLQLERQAWLKKVQAHGFPDSLVIVVLVESDEEQPYREGSRDAAPVAQTIWQWLLGEQN